MRYRVSIYQEIARVDGLEPPAFDQAGPIFQQDFDNLDVSKLILFLNQKRRVRRKKEKE